MYQGAPMRLNEAAPMAQLCAGHRFHDDDGWQGRQTVEARHLVALLRLIGDLLQASELLHSLL